MLASRRFFLGGIAALAAGRPSFALAAAAPRLRLGVLSDIHLNKPGDEIAFRKALEYFRASRVDGVLIAGDIADTGRISQLKRCADTWFEVFPNGKYPDGKRCEQLFVLGNHCVEGYKWGNLKDNPDELKADGLGYGDNRARVWKELFDEEYEPIWMKKVNGCTIVGRHWGSWDKESLKDFLSRRGGEIDPSAPFVFTQHAHPKDTCMCSWAWGHDEGVDSTELLKAYPNCVSFSGHSHYSLTDERSFWQGGFTSINTASLRYASHDYSLRENMPGNGLGGYRDEGRKHLTPGFDTGDGQQGMVVSFYADRLEIDRREFHYGERSLGPAFVLPYPAKNDGAVSFAARAAKRSAPEFAVGSEVKVEEFTEKDKKLLRVSFPKAETVDGCRVYEYEVTATLHEDDVDLVRAQRRVMDTDFYLPEGVSSNRPNGCVFDPAELVSKGHYVFSVRPIECYGRKGAAIASAVTVL